MAMDLLTINSYDRPPINRLQRVGATPDDITKFCVVWEGMAPEDRTATGQVFASLPDSDFVTAVAELADISLQATTAVPTPQVEIVVATSDPERQVTEGPMTLAGWTPTATQPIDYMQLLTWGHFPQERLQRIGATTTQINTLASWWRGLTQQQQVQQGIAYAQMDDADFAAATLSFTPALTPVGEVNIPAWVTGTLYHAGDVVRSPSNSVVVANVDHVSGVYTTDANAGNWAQGLAGPAGPAGPQNLYAGSVAPSSPTVGLVWADTS